jgi:ribonuclease PH
MKRPDGRSSGGTLRPLACELTCLHRADGSALWKAGATHVLAAVHGPLAPRQLSKEDSSTGIVNVLIKSSDNNDATSLEREWETFLSQVLMACVDVKQFPRTVIQVVLQIIQTDGSVLSCALHAAVASLLDAGILMTSLPVATTCLISNDMPMRLDPTTQEENQNDSSVVVLVNENVKPDEILACQTMGAPMTLESLLTCLQAASRASPAVVAFWRLAVEQKTTRQSQTLWSS